MHPRPTASRESLVDSIYTVEPCHPLGFWGLNMQKEIAALNLSSPQNELRFLELNTLSQLEYSIRGGARAAERILRDVETSVLFLLDDMFASKELMLQMPPERVAEMIVDIWSESATNTSLPNSCTVVSERSLAAAALELVGRESANPPHDIVYESYQGITIRVPTQSRSYLGDSVPSCPLLAAVWQMWRLGSITVDSIDQIEWFGQTPQAAERSLTILNPSLMPVEVAVGAILDTYDAEAQDRMSYLFKPCHW